MNEQFDKLREMALVTLKGSANLHVLVVPGHEEIPETKMILTKGRCMGFILADALYVLKEFSKGGRFHNAIYDTEIELVKSFFSLKNVYSENDFKVLAEVTEKVNNYIVKIQETPDEETKQIIANEANALIDGSNIAGKDELKQKVSNAITIVGTATTENPNAVASEIETQMNAILADIKKTTSEIQLQDFFDEALDILEENPQDEGCNKIFLQIKEAHTSFLKKQTEANAAAKKKS